MWYTLATRRSGLICHAWELNPPYKQMGVGGDNSWGFKTHEEYTLPAGDYSYSFVIQPLTGKCK